jgi:hypothetical protein
MMSSEMLRRVALVRTDISAERSASIIRVTRIGELGTLAVTSSRRTLSFVSDMSLVARKYLLKFQTLLQVGDS